MFSQGRKRKEEGNKEKENSDYDVMDILISLIMVIISQCICISKYHFITSLQFSSVNYTSVKMGIKHLMMRIENSSGHTKPNFKHLD